MIKNIIALFKGLKAPKLTKAQRTVVFDIVDYLINTYPISRDKRLTAQIAFGIVRRAIETQVFNMKEQEIKQLTIKTLHDFDLYTSVNKNLNQILAERGNLIEEVETSLKMDKVW